MKRRNAGILGGAALVCSLSLVVTAVLAFTGKPATNLADTSAAATANSNAASTPQHRQPTSPDQTQNLNVTQNLTVTKPSPSATPSVTPPSGGTPAASAGSAPDGVPSSLVGSKRWQYTGAQLSANGFQLLNFAGADCSPGTNGSYSTDSSGDLILTSSGNDNCAEARSTATYKAGIYEAKIYVTSAWGAYWMSGANWPANGEIDAMEILSGSASITYHGPDGASSTEFPSAVVPGWHTVDIVRQSGSVSVYWDGTKERTLSEATATNPENILFDVTDGPGTFKVAYAASWDLAS